MGGRMATYLVAEGFQAAGVILYAYPLHPPGKPKIGFASTIFRRSTSHLLFFQGTQGFLEPDGALRPSHRSLPNASVELLEGATHSLTGGGWTEKAMLDQLVNGSKAWIETVSSGSKARIRAIIGASTHLSRSL